MRTKGRTVAALALLALAFTAAAMLFIPRLGIEADEALIANGIYERGAPLYSLQVRGNEIPIMLISYVGALKSWLYNPWFLLVKPTPVTLRLPMVILSAATLWLFFALLDQTIGRKAAWIGTALLATDSSYLLLSAVDYGPIAVQFVLKLSALLLLLRFHRTRSAWPLAAAFFLFGVALWDKAVFLWVLFGLGFAVVAVFGKEVRQHLSARNLALAAGALCAGAMPLEIYNAAHPLETLRANAKISEQGVLHKADVAYRTLNGYVLFGFLTAPEPGPLPGAPRHWFQALSLHLSEWMHHPRHNLIVAALLLSVPLAFFQQVRRPILFGLIVCLATWVPMAVTAGAGGAAQHAVLLWPFHLLVIAAALSRVPAPLAIVAAAVLCLSNLAVTNQYYAELIRNGPAIRWTDAMDSLNQYLIELHHPSKTDPKPRDPERLPAKVDRIFIADWGLIETLNLLSEGDTPVVAADTSDPAVLDHMIASPTSLFVAHTPQFAYVPQFRAAIEERARLRGCEEQLLTTIADRNGRPTFEVFRFRGPRLFTEQAR